MDPRKIWLIDTAELAGALAGDRGGGHTKPVVLDGSWHLPPEKRDAGAEFLAAHIPGAHFFDVDSIADTASGLPHMLPSADVFAAAVRAMGIDNDSDVVVYDSKGLFSAARVWWTFRAFGHNRVRVLDGGLPKWRAEGRPLEAGPDARPPARSFSARLDPRWVRDKAQVLAAIAAGTNQIVDARPAGRFEGRDPEPRPGLAAGHMPGARNLPFTALVNADGTVKDATALQAAFSAARIGSEDPVIATCGSGMTAAMVVLARALLGRDDGSVYDGAWAEWGKDPALPVVQGPADMP